jgi:hypothetical protein
MKNRFTNSVKLTCFCAVLGLSAIIVIICIKSRIEFIQSKSIQSSDWDPRRPKVKRRKLLFPTKFQLRLHSRKYKVVNWIVRKLCPKLGKPSPNTGNKRRFGAGGTHHQDVSQKTRTDFTSLTDSLMRSDRRTGQSSVTRYSSGARKPLETASSFNKGKPDCLVQLQLCGFSIHRASSFSKPCVLIESVRSQIPSYSSQRWPQRSSRKRFLTAEVKSHRKHWAEHNSHFDGKTSSINFNIKLSENMIFPRHVYRIKRLFVCVKRTEKQTRSMRIKWKWSDFISQLSSILSPSTWFSVWVKAKWKKVKKGYSLEPAPSLRY